MDVNISSNWHLSLLLHLLDELYGAFRSLADSHVQEQLPEAISSDVGLPSSLYARDSSDNASDQLP